ncbi:hypothetical protein M0804_009093 [Polistes exclamans]|nr:hypothetical protein M0804_009093 [Polistes exclamans]
MLKSNFRNGLKASRVDGWTGGWAGWQAEEEGVDRGLGGGGIVRLERKSGGTFDLLSKDRTIGSAFTNEYCQRGADVIFENISGLLNRRDDCDIPSTLNPMVGVTEAEAAKAAANQPTNQPTYQRTNQPTSQPTGAAAKSAAACSKCNKKIIKNLKLGPVL